MKSLELILLEDIFIVIISFLITCLIVCLVIMILYLILIALCNVLDFIRYDLSDVIEDIIPKIKNKVMLIVKKLRGQ